FGNLHRLESVTFNDAAQHRCDVTAGDRFTGFAEHERVAHRRSPEMVNAHLDVQHILKPRRLEIVAGGTDAGKTDRFALPGCDNAHLASAQKGMFGGFHEAKEITEMHDAGHVGVAELDDPARAKNIRHGRSPMSHTADIARPSPAPFAER